MNKAIKLNDAENKLKLKNITLYHIITPVNDADFNQIKQSGYFNPSKNALGGQSNGYYFFTTHQGALNHIQTMKDTWENSADKNAYLAECTINADDIKYPNWMLDYEAMQDFLFDIIFEAATKKNIKFENIEISTNDNRTLNISENGKFSRIKSFTANNHPGLVERVSDYLYKHDNNFKQEYDKLLMDAFLGNGEYQNLYAVKTKNKQKITRISKIEKEPTVPKQQNSQINKFWERYGKPRN